jgi:succinate dehydrogenase/fumarate reductase flavoprotein subunit
MERTVDLCVVGAAGSGLSAAVVAAQNGVKHILVLEKNDNPGGCTAMSAGMMGINTPAQRRFGYKLDVDEYFKKLLKVLNWRCDAKLVRKWLNGSGENFEWLESLGLTYAFPCTESADMSQILPTHNRTGFWNGSKWVMEMHGPKVVKALKDACAKYGVEIITKTRAKHLLQAEGGSVVGVEAEGPDGPVIVHAKAVILATGSISSNQQLIRRFYQSEEYKDIRIMANVPHNTGDGLIMAEEIGAAPGRIGTLFIGPHNHYPYASEVMSVLMRRAQPIKVNQNGERFTDESIPFTEEFGWMMAVSVDSQPGKKSFSLTDQNYIDACMQNTDYRPARYDTGCQLDAPASFGPPCPVEKGQDPDTWRERIIDHLKYEEERGHAKICQTLDEAAEFIGCDPQVLKDTVEHYNLSCARGYDDEFLKAKEYLMPIVKAPYYVMLGMSGIDTCLGGLKVDHRQRVMNKEGRSIPGLYAAGVMCSGWLNDNYCFFGSEMSYTIFSGRSSGKEAAQYIEGQN